ncbi:hypothetical protein [Amycolatopsis tolypomycina]|uniref:hypothetical protein n=1 Tax=Amycolatopsis tolypomycina TaxID=208445 RepID=UPI00339F1B51
MSRTKTAVDEVATADATTATAASAGGSPAAAGGEPADGRRTAEPGALESGALGFGAPESGASEPGASEPGAPKSGTSEPSALGSGALGFGAHESGASEPSAPKSSAPKSGTPEPGESGAPEPGEPRVPEPSALERGTPEPGTPEPSTPEPGNAAETDAAAADTETEPGDPAPEAAAGPGADVAPEETTEAPARVRPAWLRLPAFLLAAAVLLAGAGVWFTVEARSVAADPAAANLALTDVGATADVTSAVTLAMNRIFSYSYDRTDVTEKAAAAVLRGAAKDSYDKLFAQVREKAPAQKLVLTSRVSAIAVQDLRNGHAKLLVFLDQSAVRADNNATDTAAAQLSVTAERTGYGWVVTELEPR